MSRVETGKELRLRVAVRGDEARLTWDPTMSTERVNAALVSAEQGSAVLLVLEEGEHAVGTVMVDLRHGMLWQLGVTPERRRQGLGTLLLGHAEEALRELGWARARLMVERGNHVAKHLYESEGYAVRREHGREVVRELFWSENGRLGRHLCVEMEKELGSAVLG